MLGLVYAREPFACSTSRPFIQAIRAYRCGSHYRYCISEHFIRVSRLGWVWMYQDFTEHQVAPYDVSQKLEKAVADRLDGLALDRKSVV